jgi:hypothetical protein
VTETLKQNAEASLRFSGSLLVGIRDGRVRAVKLPLGTRMIGPLILITLNHTLPPGTASRLSQAARRW